MDKPIYELIVTTTYNIIRIKTTDYTSNEIREILAQPYIISVEMHQISKEITRKRTNKG